MTFKISNKLPIPKMIVGRPRIYPFPDMEVGDNFAVPIQPDDKTNGRLLRCAARAYSCKYGGKFTVRIERSKKVIRCWRVE